MERNRIPMDELTNMVERRFGAGQTFTLIDPLGHIETEVLATARVGGLGFQTRVGNNPPPSVVWEDFAFEFINVSDSLKGGDKSEEYIFAKHLPTGKFIDSDIDMILSDGGEVYGTTLIQLPKSTDNSDD